jgi:hypothetical protein
MHAALREVKRLVAWRTRLGEGRRGVAEAVYLERMRQA